MIEVHDRPLITFALFAYNQEKFIREAVEGAFAQTYSPLEIILSDDCSSDGTFEIMTCLVQEYSGPHTVHLNRNDRNLGIINHLNHVLPRAQGDLFIMAAGDDTSFSHRTAVLVDTWLAYRRQPDGLCSGFVSAEHDIERIVEPPTTFSALEHCRRGTSRVPGATAAWTRNLWETWGTLPKDSLAEDRVLSLRALLSGGVVAVAEPLVRSRRNYLINDQLSVWERMWWKFERERVYLTIYERDVKYGVYDKHIRGKLLKIIKKRKFFVSLESKLLKGNIFHRFLSLVLFAIIKDISEKKSFRQRTRTVFNTGKHLLQPRFVANQFNVRNHNYIKKVY
jgi:glycosyltransferase involved in cell wall biosynthesis